MGVCRDMTFSRRDFVTHGAAGGALLLTFWVAGCEKTLTPAQARTEDVPLRTLDAAQAKTLNALGDILVPGSAALGLAHYIDHQLSGDAAQSMLISRYLGLNPPFADFYKSALAGAESAAQMRFSRAVSALTPDEGHALVADMAKGNPPGWSGPPAPLFYYALRCDAVDVGYGTQAGFETLGIPYMAHIAPPTRWGA
jgi:hypothetical protein